MREGDAMKERPILFSGPMVRAILEGRKTQTRRVVKCAFQSIEERDDGVLWLWREDCENATDHWYPCPYGQPGDRLWVRETWRGIVQVNGPHESFRLGVAQYIPDQEHCCRVEYSATQEDCTGPWRPSIHMPRWASRILLEIVSVRVERLQDISEDDAKAEGAPFELGELERLILGAKAKYRSGFIRLWQSINGRESWDANPWVWVIEFRRVQQ